MRHAAECRIGGVVVVVVVVVVIGWSPVMADGGDNDSLVTNGTLMGVRCNLSTVG